MWFGVYGQRFIGYRLCFTVYGLCFMVDGLWLKVYGVWCMVYGVWCMVYGESGDRRRSSRFATPPSCRDPRSGPAFGFEVYGLSVMVSGL